MSSLAQITQNQSVCCPAVSDLVHGDDIHAHRLLSDSQRLLTVKTERHRGIKKESSQQDVVFMLAYKVGSISGYVF